MSPWRRRRDLVGGDVLRDATGLAGGDARLADRVEQRRLAVVDVTHDGDDRRARLSVLGLVDLLREDVVFLEGDVLDLVAELAREDLRGVEVDRGVDVHAGHAHAPQLLQHLGRLDAHAAREVGRRGSCPRCG